MNNEKDEYKPKEVSIKIIFTLFALAAFSGLMGSISEGLLSCVYIAMCAAGGVFSLLAISIRCEWITPAKLEKWSAKQQVDRLARLLRWTALIGSLCIGISLVWGAGYFLYLNILEFPEFNNKRLLYGMGMLSAALGIGSLIKLLLHGRVNHPSWKFTFKSGMAGALICSMASLLVP